MKRIISILTVCVLMLTSLLTLACCGKSDEYQMMTLSTNPSVEFVLNGNGKVESVTGLNEDGDVVVSGEAFVGKTAEQAAELYLNICIDCGYISGSTAEVSIAINGENVSNLLKNVKAKITSVLDEANITATIKEVADTLNRAALEQLALMCDATLTAEAVKELDDQELMTIIATARKETAQLATAKLREMYYEAKAYEFKFAEAEHTRKIINEAGTLYTALLASYDSLLTSYNQSIQQVEEAKYNYLVNPESDYQKTVTALLEAKKVLLEQRQNVANLSEGWQKDTAEGMLILAEQGYEKAEKLLNDAATAAENGFETLIAAMQGFETQLTELRATFPSELNTILTNKAQEIEDAANTAKDSFFTTFETQYAQAIEQYETRLSQYKQSLKDANAEA